MGEEEHKLAGIVTIEDCFDWAVPSIQNDPGVFGLHLDPLVERLADASGMIDLPNHSILRLAAAMHTASGRDRFFSRIVAKNPERCEELVGQANSPEVISLWKTVLGWEKPPENVVNAFYDWCNHLNRMGFEYQLANVISGAPSPDWLNLARIDEPTRNLIY